MGDPKFPRKAYDTPSHPWKGERIKAEAELVTAYGLKNKKELWKAESSLRGLRTQSKNLQARVRLNDQQAKLEAQNLLHKCGRMGLLPMDGSTLDDVLTLRAEAMLGRRLQTIVLRKGLANTYKQARQLIVHGHISIDDRKVTIPGYTVKRGEEESIRYNPHSPIANELHPLRQVKKEAAPAVEVEKETNEEKVKVPKKIMKDLQTDTDAEVDESEDNLPEETDDTEVA